MEQNNHYQRHLKTLEAMRSRGTSPKDFMKNLKGVNNSLQRTRKFQSMERSREEMAANFRMISRFVEIDNGQRLSVPWAAYLTHIVRSPVQKQHSLNKDKKKIEDIHLLNKNLKLLENLNRVESTTKFNDL